GYARSGRAGGYGADAAGGPATGPAPATGPVPGPAADQAAAARAGGPAAAGAAQSPDTALTAVSTTAGAGALLALVLCGAAALRRRSRTGRSPATDA
ncbi:hypothetical protein ACFXNY_30835, partial [Streptomyces sindenensis]